MFFVCQPGYQDLLLEELATHGLTATEHGPGWVQSTGNLSFPAWGPAFPHAWISETREYTGESVNALAQRLAADFLESLRGERIEGTWPCVFSCPPEIVGLGRRVAAVQDAFLGLVKAKLARIAKLAVADVPRALGPKRGWFVHFVDFGRAFGGRECVINGPRRMADDERAPSRSYLKVEEAYLIFGDEPRAEQRVADLGAAPGGWSFSAAKRGARVVAVDNGPLKGGAWDHPLIDHRREDAFTFRPGEGECFDWLFCDLVEDPHHVLQNIAEPWLSQRWCRRFVLNLKFGRVAPVPFLREIAGSGSVFARHSPGYRIRHLYHDREEFTVVGEIGA